MTRSALSVTILGGLLFSSSAWAIPQASSCRARGQAPSYSVLGPAMCLLVQDPWQDCNEDPWQLTALLQSRDNFSDPWQDGEDPWQPFAPPPTPPAEADGSVDPWQPLVSQLAPAGARAADVDEDPWQPTFADPWQVR
jgi:hypothetical protein